MEQGVCPFCVGDMSLVCICVGDVTCVYLICIYTHHLHIFLFAHMYTNVRAPEWKEALCLFLCRPHSTHMKWLQLVGSLKLQVSFSEYSLFYRALLQKRPIILRSLLIVANPYLHNLYSHKSNTQRQGRPNGTRRLPFLCRLSVLRIYKIYIYIFLIHKCRDFRAERGVVSFSVSVTCHLYSSHLHLHVRTYFYLRMH